MLLKSKLLSRSAFCCLSISLLSFPSRSALADENYTEKPGTEGNGNVIIGPDYKLDPDLIDRGNPKGRYFEFSMRLADSKIFRGDDPTLEISTVFSERQQTTEFPRL